MAEMRITNAAEYRLPVKVIGAMVLLTVLFVGTHRRWEIWRFDSSSLPRTKGAAGSECFVSRASKIMYS
jgi:hypothetical protein